MDEQIKIEAFSNWVEVNRPYLPINSITWKVQVVYTEPIEKDIQIRLGKYEALKIYTISFYKPYSRFFLL